MAFLVSLAVGGCPALAGRPAEPHRGAPLRMSPLDEVSVADFLRYYFRVVPLKLIILCGIEFRI